MSYTILYRSMFVKLSNGKYIPLVEIGDNNVYDCSGRRSRSWQQWIVGGQHKCLAFTRNEIMNEVESVIDEQKARYANKPIPEYEHKEGIYTEQDIEKRFGYFSGIAISGRHCNDTTAQQFRNFFLKGFDQAVTFAEESLELDLHWCPEYPNYKHRYVKSEQELTEAWEELQSSKCDIWISYRGSGDYLWEKYRKRAKPRQEKDHTVGFVVNFGYRYVEQMTSRRLWHTDSIQYAKKYASRSSAEKVAEKIRTRYHSITEEPKVFPVRQDETGKWKAAA